MLENRIIDTLRFFSVQDVPLTLFELHKYLLTDVATLTQLQNEKFELTTTLPERLSVSISTLARVLHELVEQGQVAENFGYYALPKNVSSIKERWRGHSFGVIRERLIRRFSRVLQHIPFVRGVGLAGSQAMGLEKEGSDIDLFVITDANFLWIARTALTFVLQILGVRRHGVRIANRFCLNHYLAGCQSLPERNLYTALEYAKLRPLVCSSSIVNFLELNRTWIETYFSNFKPIPSNRKKSSVIQWFLELLLRNRVGTVLERLLGKLQIRRIHTEEFVVVRDNELSFHPNSKQEKILRDFFATL